MNGYQERFREITPPKHSVEFLYNQVGSSWDINIELDQATKCWQISVLN
ncbi:MAG: hypothetical protein RL129_538 [Actinomycetota bacterium]